ncbi:MAG: AraC family transcriptional regulator [Clostridia bacterium BRH_c25]|nr:MAG: AraC family transcriptional regulator [Clostridia bacterium BRH_c25]
MRVRDASEKIGLKLLAGSSGIDKELTGAYICDLLSWVMSHGNKGDAWITVQTHSNIIAVAVLLELGCIIVPEGIEVEEETLRKAEDEGIPVFQSSLSAYELAKELYKMGIE